MYRILGSGVLCLAKLYPGAGLLFHDKQNLVVWETLQQLKEKIDYYLECEPERYRIARNGNDLAKSNYTFYHMVKNLIKLYNERKN
jgi:spore maturation protein CgeB